MSVLVDTIVILGMRVVVPAGLRLTGAPELDRIRRLWPLFAAPGAVSLLLPRGGPATALAACYALGATLLALHPPPRPLRTVRSATTHHAAPAEITLLTALVTPSVAALALVAERSGHTLFGFGLGILALTVSHFHFAGFAAALVSGLVCRVTDSPRGPVRRAERAARHPAGPRRILHRGLGGAGGAVVPTARMWTVALLTWRTVRGRGRDRVTRLLFGTSAAVLVVTMVLALSWALGEATGLPHPTLTWMAATHGLGNALGFALCSVLAWRRLRNGAGSARTAPTRTVPLLTGPFPTDHGGRTS
jgi:hypothetical protein